MNVGDSSGNRILPAVRNVKQLALNYIDLPTFDNNYRYGC